MRRLHLIITVPLTILIVMFVIFNQQLVDLTFWPFSTIVRLPAFLLTLGSGAIGLLIGALLMWLPLQRWRRRANANQRRIDALMASSGHNNAPEAAGRNADH